MKMLAEDIKNKNFKTSYLLYGEEAYLKYQYRDRLRNALADPADTMNVSCFQGKGINTKEIMDLADTLPFFAPRRLLLIEDSGFFKNKCDELADYLPDIPDSSCLLFVETEVDKRSRLFKAVKNCGRVVEFTTQSEATLMKWVAGILGREGKKITEATLRQFLLYTGSDMKQISMELEKLLSYTYGRDVITPQDLDEICTVQVSNRIFEMLRAIAEKRQKEALDLYYDLLALEETPNRILFLLARQFDQLLFVKSMALKGYGKNAAAEKLKVPPFVAGRLIAQAKSFSLPQLEAAVKDCVDAEEAIKTGQMNAYLSLELLLLKYSA